MKVEHDCVYLLYVVLAFSMTLILLVGQVFRTFNASKTLQEQLEELTEGKCPIPIPPLFPFQCRHCFILVRFLMPDKT